jgi:hypothetical protein
MASQEVPSLRLPTLTSAQFIPQLGLQAEFARKSQVGFIIFPAPQDMVGLLNLIKVEEAP